ncbi:hypothetical protein Klosneuvirus_5_17 [Klosneuvirus KNV1]|uniref:Uncharacterized protein n=1 Tax=Klosneuvirus KNV1 TaxID=1977640 RepID=A0A1V0SKU4_9VIRU|nr:hypothetical protein Klosneuvirus_5_17 [Klosneuvirus KNV1]
MLPQIFYTCLFLAGWYFIHLGFTNPQINIQMYRNNTYVIRGDQIAKFEMCLPNKQLNCTLSAFHDMNNFDILIYRHYSGYYDVFNRTIRYGHSLTDKFYSGDMIKHIGNCRDSLLIDCETV